MNTQKKQCLLFHVDHQICSIEISCIKEVLRNALTEDLPKQPKFTDGLLNLRGQFIPIIDLRRRFLFPTIEEHLDQRIIAVHLANTIVGLKVDSIINVEELELNSDLSNYLEKIYIKQHFIDSISLFKNELVVNINIEELFSEIEADLLKTPKLSS